ncbi:hypothetical protein [Salipiger abyssi]|uniref:hypothetical protein n=1 Tax=Salipiger abyssi TaxID=1250539 RepID=UPI001A8F7527|nr:hypothetical protein [Salipiger abyssi]MBN9887421.1 hypothetical protein [Salipiger abyssi]
MAAPDAETFPERLMRALTAGVDMILRGAAMVAVMELAVRGLGRIDVPVWDYRWLLLVAGLGASAVLGYVFMLAGCVRTVAILAEGGTARRGRFDWRSCAHWRRALHWRTVLKSAVIALVAAGLFAFVIMLFSLKLADAIGILDEESAAQADGRCPDEAPVLPGVCLVPLPQ